MDKKKVIIVTGTGDELGTGHIQRMFNLASYITGRHDFNTGIFIQRGDIPIPESFRHMMVTNLTERVDLIIRDMRDSSANEITSLSSVAPVLAVDDAGSGRNSAAYIIDLLPNKIAVNDENRIDLEKFIYGYNFTRGIESMDKTSSLKRDIDITIYAGIEPPAELLLKISKSIPENTRAVLLSSGRPVVLTGEPLPDGISYAEILTRSKIVMTHFGITMFEAHICGCMIAAINPTPYHDQLTELVRREMKIIHSTLYSDLDPIIMGDDIAISLKKETGIFISTDRILNSINVGLENFTRYIYKILM